MAKVFTVLFTSRNKDNKNVLNFKQRTKSFLVRESELTNVEKDFEKFVADGLENETSRYYVSVNSRDEEKVKKDFLCFMVQHSDYPLEKLSQKLVSLADKPENALSRKWLFDFDDNNVYKLREFLQLFPSDVQYNLYPTKNGYAVVCEHGFDTRELADWRRKTSTDVTLKRDAKLLVKWKTKS